MRHFELLIAAFAVAGSTTAVHAYDGSGFIASPDALQWPHWQGRLSFNSPSPVRGPLAGAVTGATGVSMMSDYYLTGSLVGRLRAGGFRATSGVLVGLQSGVSTVPLLGALGGAFGYERKVFGQTPALAPAEASNDPTTVPYLGFGYTGWSAAGGWRFNADLGVMSLKPGGGVKLGRVFTGGQSLDDTLRDMRWAPVFQVGVSYLF